MLFKDNLAQGGANADHLEVFAGLQQSVMDYLAQMLEEQKNAVKVDGICIYSYMYFTQDFFFNATFVYLF